MGEISYFSIKKEETKNNLLKLKKKKSFNAFSKLKRKQKMKILFFQNSCITFKSKMQEDLSFSFRKVWIILYNRSYRTRGLAFHIVTQNCFTKGLNNPDISKGVKTQYVDYCCVYEPNPWNPKVEKQNSP